MNEQSTKVQGDTVDGSDATAISPAIEIIDNPDEVRIEVTILTRTKIALSNQEIIVYE